MSNLTFKIIMLGNSSVGKTSIVNRFIGDRFQTDYKSTIGPDYQFKLLQMQGNEVRLEVWDLVGMDTSYKGLNRNFCREAQGVIMVADIGNMQSIEDTAQWKQEVDEIVVVNGNPIPIVLCLNKVDTIEGIDESQLDPLQTEEGMREFAQENGFFDSYRVSAREDINISTAFSTLTREMIISVINNQHEEE